MQELATQITIGLSHTLEILAAVIIGMAAIRTMISYISLILPAAQRSRKEEIRIRLGSSVAVSLELLLGADVLATAVAPGWDAIGKLASIAILRTALNYFLAKELTHIQSGKDSDSAPDHSPGK